MKWVKKNLKEGELRIVKRFAFIPIPTDDEFIVWLQNYWVVKKWTFVVDDFMWVQLYTGSTHFMCKEFQYKWNMRALGLRDHLPAARPAVAVGGVEQGAEQQI